MDYRVFTMRVYELARELRQHSADLVRAAQAPSHLSTLDEDTEAHLRQAFPRRYHLPPKHRRRRGPKPVSFEPPWDEYSDPRSDLRYVSEWSTRDVARYFDVRPATVRQWVRRGYIAPSGTERGSHVFLSADVIDAHRQIEARTKDRPGMRVNVRPKYYERRISSAQAARTVEVAPSTVRSWISRGHLPATRDDAGRVLVLVEDLVRVARSKRHPTLPPNFY